MIETLLWFAFTLMVAVMLMFVGLKMLFANWLHTPIGASRSFICLTLAASVFLPVLVKKK